LLVIKFQTADQLKTAIAILNMSTTNKPAFKKIPASSQASEEEIIVFADAQVSTLSAAKVAVNTGQQLPVATPAPTDYNVADEKIELPAPSQVHQQPTNVNQRIEAASISLAAENNTTTWIAANQAPITIPTPDFALIKQRRVAAQRAAGFYGAAIGLIFLGPAGAIVFGFVGNKITKGIAKSAETRIRRDYLRKIAAAKAAAMAELPVYEAEVA